MLLQVLCRFQAEQGWSDGQMAARLGIERSAWNRTRRRKIPVGLTLLRGAIAAFPELGSATMAELMSDEVVSCEQLTTTAGSRI